MSDVDTVTDDAPAAPAASDFDFRAALPEELREHSALAPIKDLGGLAKSFIAAQELVGADRVALPAPDAAAEKWEAFYDRVGRPETPDGYRLDPPESLPDGFSYSDAAAERFREWAHTAGLTPRQASQLHGAFVENVAETLQELEAADAAAVAEADRAVREAWGGDYDRNLALAGRALDVLGGAAHLAALTDESHAGHRAALDKRSRLFKLAYGDGA